MNYIEKYNQTESIHASNNTGVVTKRYLVIKKRRTVRQWVITAFLTAGIACGGAIGGAAIMQSSMSEDDVTYKEVYIGKGGSAFGAINELNGDVDVRALLPMFEEKNDVKASTILAGTYYVPVLKD